MKKCITLYIKESLFDDEDELIEDDSFIIERDIFKFLGDNYKFDNGDKIIKHPEWIKIKKRADKQYEVSTTTRRGLVLTNLKIESFTEGKFVWGKISSLITRGGAIKSLQDLPKQVIDDITLKNLNFLQDLTGASDVSCGGFYLIGLSSLKNLKGCPQQILEKMDISECGQLTSLKGAPKETTIFIISRCEKLKNLTGGPQHVKVFNVNNCTSLKDLTGAPQIVENGFYCTDNDKLTSLKGSPKQMSGRGIYRCINNASLITYEGSEQTVGVDAFVVSNNGKYGELPVDYHPIGCNIKEL